MTEPLLPGRAVRLAALGLGAVVGLALLALGGWAWQSAQESRARAALVAAADLAQDAQAPGATAEARERAVKALELVLAQHGGASVAPQAAYRLANLHYAAGRHAAARGAYEIALRKGASGTLRSLAAAGIGYAWEGDKDPARAQHAYEAALTGLTAGDFLYEDLLLARARVQEMAGNRSGALGTYDRLLRELPDSRHADEVRARIASLQSLARP